MKRTVQSKASKSSLIARGLAAKPVRSKKNVKLKRDPEVKPSYSLYSTDSEDQASAVGHGLDRCAALLTNILDNENSDQGKKKMSVVTKPSAKTVKTAAVKGKHPSVAGSRPVKARLPSTRAVVVPTADNQQDSPSPSKSTQHLQRTEPPPAPATLYNDRLVASTPLLMPDERQRQQELLQREQELTQQLAQLKHHYQLLQKSPELQDQQKRQLQSTMLHELENFQQSQPEQQIRQGSERASSMNSRQDSPDALSIRTPSARRSLEYTSGGLYNSTHHRHSQSTSSVEFHDQNEPVTSEMRTFSENRLLNNTPSYLHSNSRSRKHILDNSYSRRKDQRTESAKKQVRIVSPSLQERQTAGDSVESSKHGMSRMHGMEVEEFSSPESSPSQRDYSVRRPRSAPPISKGEPSPSAIDKQTKTLQYLVGELREVIGNTDDLEVDRLLMEIDQTTSLLPYIYASRSPQPTAIDSEIAAQPLSLENAQLRRKLRIANQKLQENEIIRRSVEDLQSGHSSVSFELAACKSENASLQKQVQDEREKNGRLRSNIVNLEKEHDYTKTRRSSQHEASRLAVEVNQLKSELEASKLSAEATQKENIIVNLSLKQKDAEIERLGNLTRSLQQTMRRVLVDVQEYHPNSVVREKLLRQPDVLGQMGVTLNTTGPARLTTPASFHPRTPGTLIMDDLGLTSTRSIQRTTTKPSSKSHISYTPRDLVGHRNTSYDRSLLRPALDNSITSQEVPTDRNPVGFSGQMGTKIRSPGMSKSPRMSPNGPRSPRRSKSPAGKPLEGPGYLNTLAVLGRMPNSPAAPANDTSADLSSLSSRDEEEFQRDLASLDADIARIQRSLRQTALLKT